jgi:hypothetical protein
MRLVLILLVASTFSGALLADRVTYWKVSGDKRTAESLDEVAVTAWNAKEVTCKPATGAVTKLETAQIISINRADTGGSMGAELKDALDTAGRNAAAAKDALLAASSKGSEIDREEALFRRAELYEADARSGSGRADAIRELQAYVSRYKAGFFARDAYTTLAEFQAAGGKVADARATLKAMIGADTALARLGNQKLGELEADAKDWKAALAAFKSAESAANGDRNARYLAMAWQGAVLQKSGDNNGAKDILEKVTGDDAFEDETSEEDESALGVAWPALAEALNAGGSLEKAYNAYVLGAYYVWWNQGTSEGYCLRQACICAKKLQSGDEKWKSRYEKLRSTLASGYPKELAEVDKVK